MNKIKDAWNHQEEIIICNCNREGIHKIAKKFNCNHWVIYRILESNGIKPLGRKTSFNQRFNKEKANELKMQIGERSRLNLPEKEIISLYKKMSSLKIAKKFNCSYNVIIKILKRNNIKIKSHDYFLKGKHNSPSTEFKKGEKNKYAEQNKEKWKDQTYKENQLRKMASGATKKPNKPETLIINIIKQYNINLIYVGDWSYMVKGFNPDFINKNEKKIVEFNGDYWHSLPSVVDRDKRKMNLYRIEGYRTLVLSDKDLKNKEELSNKLINFAGVSNERLIN